MSEPRDEKSEFSKLSVAELAQAYVENVEAAEAVGHVGRQNRFADWRWQIVQELKTRGEARSVLQRLADHANPEVREQASGSLARLDNPAPSPAPQRLTETIRPSAFWQCDHAPPPAPAREEIAERLRQSVPEFCDRLMELALPAIGLWPQRRAAIAATASRFGGMPLAPPGWQWPTFEEEPLLFVGQINCAELRGLPGAELLPSSGLLAFFGDHDAVTGCDPFGDHCVFYWPRVGRLVPATSRLDPIVVFPACALALRPILDLPYPDSRAVEEFGLNKGQRESYFDVWREVREHGIPPDCVRHASFSKLLGWPHLLQNELERFDTDDDARLLLQVDEYFNGEEVHSWGRGGALYYVLRERDLRAQMFERCELQGQFT